MPSIVGSDHVWSNTKFPVRTTIGLPCVEVVPCAQEQTPVAWFPMTISAPESIMIRASFCCEANGVGRSRCPSAEANHDVGTGVAGSSYVLLDEVGWSGALPISVAVAWYPPAMAS